MVRLWQCFTYMKWEKLRAAGTFSDDPRGTSFFIHAIRAATHIHLALSERGKTMEKPWKNHTLWMIHQCFPTKIAIFGVCIIFRDIHLNLVEDLEKDLALRRWRSIQPDMISEVSAQPFKPPKKSDCSPLQTMGNGIPIIPITIIPIIPWVMVSGNTYNFNWDTL